MNKVLEKLELVLGQNRIKQAESLVGHTRLKREVIAEFYTEVEKSDDLIKAVQTAQQLGLAYYVFGSGSKIIFAEEETAGLVIKNNSRRLDVVSMKGKIKQSKIGVEEAIVHADSGVNINQLVRFTIDEGFEGLEYFLGAEGTIGGALYNNITYAPKRLSVWAHVQALRILTADGEVNTYMDKIDFFRRSRFLENNKAVLVSALFKLLPNDKKLLWQRGEEAVTYRNN